MSEDNKLAPPGTPPARGTRAFRDALLGRLPTLPVPEWRAKEVFDVQKETRVLGELGADAFLDPLARRLGGGRG